LFRCWLIVEKRAVGYCAVKAGFAMLMSMFALTVTVTTVQKVR
jgi:hypothetical protein